MKIQTVAGTRTLSGEPPRSTAYYYADLERLKRKNGQETQDIVQNPDELNEYVDTNEVVNDGAIREVPPFRDRARQWSLPEYNTPENSRKAEETYSTAGTFPMPEPKEKEPLLAELEVVGRLPLTQLETSSGVRRSRSWYLCCPNVADEEISRESSWRYSSLRPVTAPPIAGQNGIHMLMAPPSSQTEDVASLRAERDALSRALAAERARAATAARAHDARLAELHGVIAELVRRRALDSQARAIPEEELSDECESTTQPAGELDVDADRSRTDQDDWSPAHEPGNASDTSTRLLRSEALPAEAPDPGVVETPTEAPAEAAVEAVAEALAEVEVVECDTSLNLSERDSDTCVSTHECCEGEGTHTSGADSDERQRGSDEHAAYAHCARHSLPREPKLACRVRLRPAHTSDSSERDRWSPDTPERLAHELETQADLREALVAAQHNGAQAGAGAGACACARLRAERRVLRCALARAADTARRLHSACAVGESTSVALCVALRAADRALEAYDVLLALAETGAAPAHLQRESAEQVAGQVLWRLEHEAAALGEPLLSPGPWLRHRAAAHAEPWSSESEARLREHAARLKAATVALRAACPPPKLFSYHDIDESELPKLSGGSAAEMEAAVALLDALEAKSDTRQSESSARRPRCRPRHWLHPRASETPL